ncbi:hypothetical protein CPLU01_12715 [Colletotrichum plurivorum]|uniref:Uncharacterized protein n=1 Tax=Colletotrichum plurivorum TaxID=2175906 RepID=A0A8H6JXJ2_9PEZI|nr:hypothetical protein CPLU01_12715 [Colletotrichum plurivorum]
MIAFVHFAAFLSAFAALSEAAAVRFRSATVPKVERRTVSFSLGPGMPSLESLNMTMDSLLDSARLRINKRSESLATTPNSVVCHHTPDAEVKGRNADVEVIEACITYLEVAQPAVCSGTGLLCEGFNKEGKRSDIYLTGVVDTSEGLCTKVVETLKERIVPPCCTGADKSFCNGYSSIFGQPEPAQEEKGEGFGALSAGLIVEVSGDFGVSDPNSVW